MNRQDRSKRKNLETLPGPLPRVVTDEEGTRWLVYQGIKGRLKRERINPCRLPTPKPEPSNLAASF